MNMSAIDAITLAVGVRAQNGIHDLASALNERLRDRDGERGEGVISAAIAVLIFALIGSLMWVAYAKLFNKSSTKTGELVDKIGESVAP